MLSREDRYRGHLLSFQSVGYPPSIRTLDGLSGEDCPGALVVKSGKTLKWAQPGRKIRFPPVEEAGWEESTPL